MVFATWVQKLDLCLRKHLFLLDNWLNGLHKHSTPGSQVASIVPSLTKRTMRQGRRKTVAAAVVKAPPKMDGPRLTIVICILSCNKFQQKINSMECNVKTERKKVDLLLIYRVSSTKMQCKDSINQLIDGISTKGLCESFEELHDNLGFS